jgi:hypothetical protein
MGLEWLCHSVLLVRPIYTWAGSLACSVTWNSFVRY